jgi:hypothetical protein
MTGSRPRLLGVLLLLAAFAAGFAAGLASDRLEGGGRRGSLLVRVEAPGAVLDKLGLTPEQRSRAEAISNRRAPRTEAMMGEIAERFRQIADSVDAELRAILTEEQRVRLDSLRSGQRILLKRKVNGPDGGVTTDTVFPRRDTTLRP